MYSHLIKAFRQISDPAFRRVIVKGAAAAMALFIALVGAAAWGFEHLALTGIDWIDQSIAAIGGIGAVIVAGLLFPGAMVAVQGVFLDDAALAVETRHYSESIGIAPPFARSLWSSLRLAGITILLNLLVLPFYLLPAVNMIVFYGLNGYLLGREYFELVAIRHMTFEQARALRRRNHGATFVAGVAIAVLFTIPVLNWFMSAFAAAFMVHMFEGVRRR